MPNTYNINGLTLVFNEEDPQKTKESIQSLMQNLTNKIDKSNEQLESQVNMLSAYNRLTELCIDTRRLQDSAMQASKVSNGPLFAQNFTSARAKFKDVQTQVKHIQDKKLDKVAASGEIGNILAETKKSVEALYKNTASNSSEMIKHAAYLKQLGEQHAAAKKSSSSQVQSESTANSSGATPLRMSSYDAKRIESKTKAENANRVIGSAAPLNNPNVIKK